MAAITIDQLQGLNPGAVIFDLDGTIYDKRHLTRRIIVGQAHALTVLSAERATRKKLRGQWFGSEEAFYNAFFRAMASGHVMSEKMARMWWTHEYMPLQARVLRLLYKPRKWVLEIIRYCHEHQIPVAVYSDYGFVNEKLAALGLDSTQFNLVVSAPELGGLKPCKQSMEAVIARLGVLAERCLMIGDREDTDGESAAAVGAMYLKC